jgi:hypothetical protein
LPNRQWRVEEEQELIRLWREGTSVEALAEKYKRTPDAVKMKLKRLGVDIVAAKIEITGNLDIPKELPSLKDVLRLLSGALNKAKEPGLGKTELERLKVIADLYRAYADGLERYVRYSKIEKDLEETKKEIAEQLAKAKAQGIKA